MNPLTEQDLSDILQRAVGDPGDDRTDRAAMIQQRARQLRRRNVAAVAAVAVAMAVVAIPAWLAIERTTGDGSDHAAGAPTPDPCTAAGCPADVLAQLHRPLDLPTVAPGEPCPTGPTREFGAGGGFNAPFSGSGPGPVYLASDSDVSFTPAPETSADGSGEAKVIWVFDADYEGPLLFRGAQIDGDHDLSFVRYLGTLGDTDGPSAGPHDEVVYLRDSSAQDGPGYYTYPGVLRLDAAGCYAVQIDGPGFSETLVFEASNANS